MVIKCFLVAKHIDTCINFLFSRASFRRENADRNMYTWSFTVYVFKDCSLSLCKILRRKILQGKWRGYHRLWSQIPESHPGVHPHRCNPIHTSDWQLVSPATKKRWPLELHVRPLPGLRSFPYLLSYKLCQPLGSQAHSLPGTERVQSFDKV